MQSTMQPRSLTGVKPSARPSRQLQLRTQALFSKKASSAAVAEKPTKQATKQQTLDKAEEYKKRQGLFGSAISALDFAEVRSKSDAQLLYEAKYELKKGEKMSREQYMALRRRVGGTAKDFWKTSIDVQGKYTDKGYISSSGAVSKDTNALLPFVALTLLAMFGTLAAVVAQTS